MINPNTEKFWNRKMAEERDSLLKSPIFVKKNNIVVNRLRMLSGRLLDVGVGYGVFEKLLVKKVPKLKIFGIDISSRAINEVSTKIKGKFLVASALKIPFGNCFFDCVIVLDVLEHFRLQELVKVISEIKRVLVNNGLFIISVPLNESEKDKKENRHLVSFTDSNIVGLLEKNGFSVEKTITLYAFSNWYLIKSLIAKLFKLKSPNLIIIFGKKG